MNDNPPPLRMALTPVAVMLISLLTIVIFAGGDGISAYGPWVLLASAAVALILSLASRRAVPSMLRRGFARSAAQTLPAVPLLILIALISTTWLLSGIVPTLIDIGIRILNPTCFLAVTCAVCALVSVLTGSSWTTIATIGVAFIGIGEIMGYSRPWIAGAIISGAYFGDKVSPLSDTTVIASSSCGVDLFDHIRNLMFTAIPAMTAALAVFLAVGLTTPAAPPSDTGHILDALHSTFRISPLTLTVPLIVAVMIALRIPTVITMLTGSILGLAAIFIFQPHIAAQLCGTPDDPAALLAGTLRTLWTDTRLNTGSPVLDDFVATGGILAMLPTVTLVICAMLFGAAMIGTGMLSSIAAAITSRLSRRHSVVGATVASGLMLNAATADQYLSIIIGSNMYRDTYSRNGLQPRLLSRTLEDSVSVTSVLIPWNSCGVTQSTVLSVPTLDYLPCCIFNLLSPLMSLLLSALPALRSRLAKRLHPATTS